MIFIYFDNINKKQGQHASKPLTRMKCIPSYKLYTSVYRNYVDEVCGNKMDLSWSLEGQAFINYYELDPSV